MLRIIILSTLVVATGILVVLVYMYSTCTSPKSEFKALAGRNWTTVEPFEHELGKDLKAGTVPHTVALYPINPIPIQSNLPEYFSHVGCQTVRRLNQGQCNNCSVFAVCMMLAMRLGLREGVQPKMLAVQQYLNCKPWKCSEPMSVYQPLEFAKEIGFVVADELHYASADVPDANCGSLTSNRVFAGNVYNVCSLDFEIGSKAHLENIRRMCSEIVANGPIVAVIRIYQDILSSYRATSTVDGTLTPLIYSATEGSELIGYHAIVVVGYLRPSAENFVNAAWVCVTSWSPGFPPQPLPQEPDQFFIEMGSNMVDIEKFCVSAQPYRK